MIKGCNHLNWQTVLFAKEHIGRALIKFVTDLERAQGKLYIGAIYWIYAIELLDIECAPCHVTEVQFDKTNCPYKSVTLDFLQKIPFVFAQNVLGRANFAFINPPFCGDNFLTDTR